MRARETTGGGDPPAVAPVAAPWRSRIVGRADVAPAELTANPKNWRQHPPAQRSALAGLLDQVGWVQDVVVNRRTGHLVDGHLRVDLARTRGEPTIPVIYVDLDPAEEAVVLASLDPLAGMATADPERLAALLGEAAANDAALRAMLEELAVDSGIRPGGHAGNTDPDEVPEPPAEPVSRVGDLWLLGRHRLLCGSSTVAADVRRVLQDDAPRVLLTDPPYGVELDMEWRDRAGLNGLGRAERSYLRRGDGHKNTSISGDTKADWSDAFELVPSLDTAYVWHASAFSIEVGLGLRRIGFELKQQIIWRKPHFALSRQHYHWQHEPCWYARKSGSAKFRGSRDQSTIWDAASPKMLMTGGGEEKVDHPTQKPVVLYTRPIENHLEPGECFYEPFGGSGTAIIAAEQTGRRCLAIELDPKFVDVIVARFERFTGTKAERVPAETAA